MKFNFDMAYKIVVIVAIGWLIFSMLSTFNVSSKRLDKIEQKQEEIMRKADKILKTNDEMLKNANTLDSLKALQIKQVVMELDGLRTETKKIRETAFKYKSVFEKNKIELPNPWEN